VLAHPDELVDAAHAAQDGPVADVRVAREGSIVGEHGLVADAAIMGDVRIGHEPVVVADARHAFVLHRTSMDRAELADRVAVADLGARGLARVFLVLVRLADRREMEDAVPRARSSCAR
jgi:hypothetical protein